jgi:hypothetical protein
MWFLDFAGKTEYVYARVKESSRHALEVSILYFLNLAILSLFLLIVLFGKKSVPYTGVVFVSYR